GVVANSVNAGRYPIRPIPILPATGCSAGGPETIFRQGLVVGIASEGQLFQMRRQRTGSWLVWDEAGRILRRAVPVFGPYAVAFASPRGPGQHQPGERNLQPLA